jgi:hypothetical protein
MAAIIGSFYLRQLENGNLQGEFTNNRLFTVSVENDIIKEKGDAPFIGRYISEWTENGDFFSAELKIDKSRNAEEKYKLVWRDFNGNAIYEAEAFIAEGLLIGHYVSLP